MCEAACCFHIELQCFFLQSLNQGKTPGATLLFIQCKGGHSSTAGYNSLHVLTEILYLPETFPLALVAFLNPAHSI